MKIISVYREAWRVYRQHFGELMLTFLLELVLRAIALTPLLFLAAPQLRYLALICIPMYVLIVLPARQNVALAMRDLLAGGSLFTTRLVSTEDYGRKLMRGLAAAFRMLLWCIPLIAGVLLAQWAFRGSVDGFTQLRFIRSLGGGDIFRGLLLILCAYLLTLVPPLVGCAFHCGARHAAALDAPGLIRGRRGRLVLLWLVGLLIFVPFIAAVGVACAGYVREFLTYLISALTAEGLLPPSPGPTAVIVVASVLVLLLPAIPFRSLVPAVYAQAAQREEAGANGAIHDAA